MADAAEPTGSPQYGFYSVRAPSDPRLPNGGGYLINGLDDRNTARRR